MWTCCWEVWGPPKGLQWDLTVNVLPFFNIFSGWCHNSSRKSHNCHLTTITKKTKHATSGGFQGRLLLKYCNQVSCGENKAFNETLEHEERGHFKPSETHGSSLGQRRGETDREAKFQTCFREHKLGLVGFWCTKCSLPRALTHTLCVQVIQCSLEKKHMHPVCSSRSSALFPRISLSQLCDQSLFTFVG